jgi:two-component system, OmpR family, sensor histidine kinase CpxA
MRGGSLSRKILVLALLNLTLLGVVLVVFARSQFQLGPESLLLGPARDRIVAIADSFSLALETTPANARDALFAAYAQRYNADIFLTNPQGDAIIGPSVALSRELRDKLERVAAPPQRPQWRPPPPAPQHGLPPPRNGDDDEDRPPPPQQRPPSPSESAFLVITHDPVLYWAGARIPVRLPEMDDRHPGILLLRSSSLFNSSLFFDWRLWIAVALSVVAVSVLCWLPFVRGLTHSIGEMDRVTRQIAEGRFDVQVASRRGDELGDLGRQINQMAARLQSFVKNQKRFLGDIAHELCAPIARIQFALGILEQKAAEAQQADVATLHDEIQEMSGLVNELLSFSKAGMNPEAAQVTAVPLALVVQRAIAREAFSGARIETHVPPELVAMANEAHLVRALSNVLRNAIRYAGSAGPITIGARREGPEVALTVADCGPGLPEAELEEVFAPFYRPEASRTRESGGAGLGLAIVKSCVELCRGTVKCRNREPSGLEVTIHLAAL